MNTYASPLMQPSFRLPLDGVASPHFAGLFKLRNYLIALLLHGFLGLAFKYIPGVSSFCAFVVLGVGLWWAYNKRLELVAYWGAYFTGIETLFRMTDGNPVHEFGKYGLVLVFTFALLRAGRRGKWVTPVLYLLFLAPGAFISLTGLPFTEGRQAVSGVLAGPLSIAASIVFFSSIRFERRHLVRLLCAGILPVMGVSFIALFSTATVTNIRFSTTSNKATSGGWGPNQVSSGFAFGAFLAFMGYVFERERKKMRLLMLFLLILFFAQAALTFSRSGPYLIVGSFVVASLFLFRSFRTQISVVLGAAFILVMVNYVILPQLNEFTGGAFEERVLQDQDLSGRDEIAAIDIEMFRENPIWGVGAGQSRETRALMLNSAKANRDHTEFTRLPAEHGIFGVGAMLMMLFFVLQAFATAPNAYIKALRMASMGWAYAYMLVNSTRLAAPGFLIGLAFMSIYLEEDIERIWRRWQRKIALHQRRKRLKSQTS